MGKILFISNVTNRVTSFVTASISAAHSLNMEFYQAAYWQSSAIPQISAYEQEYDIKINNIPISRNPFAITNLTAYKKLVDLIQQELYHFLEEQDQELP